MWHMEHRQEDAPGEGVAFLDFHRNFLAEFHSWYDLSPGADLVAVAPWLSIPDGVLANLNADIAQELAKIANDPAIYPTEDQLGISIHPLHDAVHQAIAMAYEEPGMNDPMTAPQYTEFWNLHGMIDRWFSVWQQAQPEN